MGSLENRQSIFLDSLPPNIRNTVIRLSMIGALAITGSGANGCSLEVNPVQESETSTNLPQRNSVEAISICYEKMGILCDNISSIWCPANYTPNYGQKSVTAFEFNQNGELITSQIGIRSDGFTSSNVVIINFGGSSSVFAEINGRLIEISNTIMDESGNEITEDYFNADLICIK